MERHLVDTFKRTFLSDDLDGFMDLIAPDCVWTIMATGESFTGPAEIRRFAERSVAARRHNDQTKIELVSLMTDNECLAVEYVHNAIVTDEWPTRTNRPAPGSKLHIPICIIAHVSDAKFDRLREYFDLATALGRPQKLYSG